MIRTAAISFLLGACALNVYPVNFPDVTEEIQVVEILADEHETAPNPSQLAADRFGADPLVRYASLGISVMDIATGKEVSAWSPMTADIPASTMKTITCASAVAILGPDYKFATEVRTKGTVSGGVLNGNIVVKGSGDPTIGSEHFERSESFVSAIISALKKKGITAVNGDIVIETCHAVDAYCANWPLDDVVWDYGAGAFLFNYADNNFTMSFSMQGKDVTLTKCNPAVPDIKLRNEIIYTSPKSGVPISGIEPYRAIDDSEIVLSGFSAPKSQKTVSGYTLSIPDPAKYFKKVLIESLGRNGIKYTEKKGDATGEGSLLTTYYSPKLSEIAASALERSDNMFTECILRAIGREKYGVWSETASIKCVRKYWESKGLEVGALFMKDGSGLARRNKVSARFMASLLSAIQNQTAGTSCRYSDLLPVAGVNGTVKPLLKDTEYSGKLAVKSGSMGEVLCYAGLYPVANPQYAIVVLVNNYSTNYKTMRARIQKFLTELFPTLELKAESDTK